MSQSNKQSLRLALAEARLPTNGTYDEMVARLLKHHSSTTESIAVPAVVATPAKGHAMSSAERDFYETEGPRLAQLGFSDESLDRELTRRWGILKTVREVEDDHEDACGDDVLEQADGDRMILSEPLPPDDEAAFGLELHTLQRNDQTGDIGYVYKNTIVSEATSKKRKRVTFDEVKTQHTPAMDPTTYRTFVDIVTARLALKLQKVDMQTLLAERFGCSGLSKKKGELALKLAEVICYETDDESEAEDM